MLRYKSLLIIHENYARFLMFCCCFVVCFLHGSLLFFLLQNSWVLNLWLFMVPRVKIETIHDCFISTQRLFHVFFYTLLLFCCCFCLLLFITNNKSSGFRQQAVRLCLLAFWATFNKKYLTKTKKNMAIKLWKHFVRCLCKSSISVINQTLNC